MSDEPQYIDSIPEQYRETPSIRDAGSMEALLQQHVNLEQKMGNSLSFPGDDADDDQLNEFYSKVNERAPGLTRIPTDDDADSWKALYGKLGRPDTADGYTLPEIEYGDGDNKQKLDQGKYGEGFRAKAHELDLSGKQFTGIMQYFGDETIANMETAKEAHDATMATLKAEWGDATDSRVARVQALVKEQGGDEAANAFGDIGNNPAVLMMLDKMADALMEESSLPGKGPAGEAATRSAIEDDIATLKNNEAFMDRKHADHERTVNRVNSLYEKLETFNQKVA